MMVEGKVDESFGPTLDEWRTDASPGKEERLGFLLHTLQIAALPSGGTRYQLLHRAASAVITGEQYRAAAAVVLVHSFSVRGTGWPDYERFVSLFGVQAERDKVQLLTRGAGTPLLGVWVTGDFSFLKRATGSQ